MIGSCDTINRYCTRNDSHCERVAHETNLAYLLEQKRQHHTMLSRVPLKTTPIQAAFVNELNSKIAANAPLKTALAAVGGYVRFSVVAATATVPEHISVSTLHG